MCPSPATLRRDGANAAEFVTVFADHFVLHWDTVGATEYSERLTSRHTDALGLFLTQQRCRVGWASRRQVFMASIGACSCHVRPTRPDHAGALPLHSMLIRNPWILVASAPHTRRSVRPDRSVAVDDAVGVLTPNVIMREAVRDQASDANLSMLTRKLRRTPPRCRLRAAIRL
jgi:hypothetical protein